MESDGSYFRRRADEEFAAASLTDCEFAKASHFELAERYAQLAAAIDEANERLGPPSSPLAAWPR
jgi:hypothetical protein